MTVHPPATTSHQQTPTGARPLRFSLTLRGMMIGIAFAGACLTIYRQNPGLGIVLACIACGALERTFGAISLRKKQGKTSSARWKIGLALTSILVGAFLIGIADLSFFLCYHFFLRMRIIFPHLFHLYGPQMVDEAIRLNAPFDAIHPFDLIVSVVFALLIAYGLRKALWPIKEKPGPRPTADAPSSPTACETLPPGV